MGFRILDLFFTGLYNVRSLSFRAFICYMDVIMPSLTGSWQGGLNEILFAILPTLSMACSRCLMFSFHPVPFCLLLSFLLI